MLKALINTSSTLHKIFVLTNRWRFAAILVLMLGVIAPFSHPAESETYTNPEPQKNKADPQTAGWSQQTSNTTNNLFSVHFTSASQGWAVGFANTIVHTTDGGTNWTSVSSPGGVPVSSYLGVRFIDSNTGWVGGGSVVMHTSDAGANWQALVDVTATNFRNNLFATSATQAWSPVNRSGGRFFGRYTFNGTSVVEEIFDDLSGSSQFFDMYFTDPDNGWAVGFPGFIRRITNASTGTVTFTAQTSGTTNTLNGIFMLDANTGWTVGNGGVILKTTNGGTNWNAQTSGTTTNLRSVHFADANNGWAVGASGLILMSTDGGASWTPEASGVTTELRRVFFVDANTGYAAGATGTILKRTVGPTTLVVTNTNDSGAGSLRQAMLDANADVNTADTIIFNIPNTDPNFSDGVFTIAPTSALPVLRNNTTIDATTQTAFTGDTNLFGPEVVLNGGASSSGNGIQISGDGNIVKGLVINGWTNGSGVAIVYGTDNTPSDNQILDNYIGTNASATAAVANAGGVSVHGFGSPSVQATNNTIQNNVISGNTSSGISLCDAATTQILNNKIGTDKAGVCNLGNGMQGINLSCAGAPNNLFDSNTIAFNASDGIRLEPDYRFLATGMTGNKFTSNSMFANGGLGINLLPPPFGTIDGVTPNDACDADTGGNLLQNFPVLNAANSNTTSTRITGSLNSAANTTFTIEFFSNTVCDASGNGEGKTYLGSTTVSTDGSCNATIDITFPVVVSVGSFITATATDPANNTSEFSACVLVTSRPLVLVTVTPANPTIAVGQNRHFIATGTFDDGSLRVLNAQNLTSGNQNPMGVAVDATNIYWLEQSSGELKKMPKMGGAMTTLASGLSNPRLLVVNGDFLYFTEDTSPYRIGKIAISGGSITTLINVPPDLQDSLGAKGLAVDGTYVYWTEGCCGSGKVRKIPVGGGAATLLAQGVQGGNPKGLALDESFVYFVDWGCCCSGGIHRVSKAGGAVTALGTGLLCGPTNLAVDEDFVYWAEAGNVPGNSSVNKIAKSGGATIALAGGVESPVQVAIDAAYVYVTASGSSLVKKVPKAGGTAINLATNLNAPWGIAEDAAFIYCTERTAAPNGTVKKIDKLGAIWTSGTPAVASINANGVAQALANGATTITATSGSISGNTTLTVKTLTAINVTPTTACLGAGNTQAFTATGTFSDSSMQTLAGDSWQSLAALPSPRRLLSAAEFNGQIYIFGGEFNGARAETRAYNPSTNTWTDKANMPNATFVAAAAAPGNGKLYVFGGFTTINLVQEYDPVNNTWAMKSPMPTGRYALAAVALNGKVYAIGGQDGSNATNVVQEYDPATDTWTTKAPMPTARRTLAAAAVNGKIYAIGGAPDCCGGSQVNVVEEYDPIMNSWTTKAPLPTALQVSAGVAVNGKIYVCGGFTCCFTAFNTVYEYDPTSNNWTTKAPMPSARWQTQAVVADGKIYVVGGGDAASNALSANEAYTPLEVLWSSSNTTAATISQTGVATGMARGDTTITATSTSVAVSGNTMLHVAAVGNLNDSGTGSLRQAILDANSNAGTDTIDFCIPGAAPYTINLLAALPTITDPVIIDGKTQSGFVSSPIIELNGASAGAGANGLHITAGNSTMQGLVINRFSLHGILLETNGSNVIQCNYIGTDVNGSADLGNADSGVFINNAPNNTIGGITNAARNVIAGNDFRNLYINGAAAINNLVQGNYIGTNAAGAGALGGNYGVWISAASMNTVGGAVAGARNLISGNIVGVELTSGATNNQVQGNYIGTDVTGASAIANTLRGVHIQGGSSNNLIGGTVAGAGNLISGNTTQGILIEASGTSGNLVQGNFIGTQADGSSALGNGSPGVWIHDSASNNTIGGTAAGAGNVIAFNGWDGVFVGSGTGNSVRGNSIHSNTQLGIDLGADGVTANDVDDSDTGANNLQNFPVITSAISGGSNTVIQAALASTPNTIFTVDFYHNATADSSGYGEGQIYLGSRTVITDDTGNTTFSATFTPAVAIGRLITATATENNNTSEFSLAVAVADSSACATLELLPTSDSFFNAGGNGAFDVIKATGCAWTAVSNAGWITNVSPASGTGNTTITYVVQANPSGARSGTITVGGQTFTVYQSDNPTLASLANVTINAYDKGALIEWQTASEADNLGFNIYREAAGKRALVNTQLIAGSALTAYQVLNAGDAYAWWDASIADCGSRIADCQNAAYWLEDVDLAGRKTLHGPFYAKWVGGMPPARSQAALLSQFTPLSSEASKTSEVTATVSRRTLPPSPNPLAAQTAVKLSINREGWYRVTQAELIAAGLSKDANPARLQMFVDGVEIPIQVSTNKDGLFDKHSFIEFYGIGLDTPSTASRTYWLVEGKQAGKRITLSRGEGVSTFLDSFTCTVERRERLLYFSALLNGERENFFGAVVTTEGVDQPLNLNHVAPSKGQTILEVNLQGVTLQAHRVLVQLNGNNLGYVDFNGQQSGATNFTLPHALLREGANTVRLLAQQNSSDVSLVEALRLTYQHTFTADNDALTLIAKGEQPITIDGFSTKAIRVFDVTNPDLIVELLGNIEAQKDGSYLVTAVPLEKGERRLLALADSRIQHPALIRANQPSKWRDSAQTADLVVLTTREFFNAIEPLRLAREKAGYKVAVIDVEDLYDEFNFGHKSLRAVKDFFAFAKTNWKIAPRFVLLVGDASYDARNYLGFGDFDFVPTGLVDTRFMETASDEWLVDLNDDGIGEIAIGRLPVRNAEEVAAVIAKLLVAPQTGLTQSALLVSDRNDGFAFEQASAGLRPLLPAGIRIDELRRSQFDDLTAKNKLLEALNRGQKLVNYIGHGSANLWRGNLLSATQARALTNQKLPVFVIMNCLNGYFLHPTTDSLGEALMKAERGGALAVWTSSGMTHPSPQASVNQDLYRLWFANQTLTLGEVIQKAKSLTTDSDIRRTWILLGDPMTRWK
ncbi:MAG: C25 family cysteine peptidase [Acidobacteriota bacterium]